MLIFYIQTFVELRSLDGAATLNSLHKGAASGLSDDDRMKRSSLYGLNLVTVKVIDFIKHCPFFFQPLYAMLLISLLYECIIDCILGIAFYQSRGDVFLKYKILCFAEGF